MSQLPPEMESHEDEVRRRVAEANYPAAPSGHLPPPYVAPAQVGPQGAPAAGVKTSVVVGVLVGVVVLIGAAIGAILLASQGPATHIAITSAGPTVDPDPAPTASPAPRPSPSPTDDPRPTSAAYGDPPFATDLTVTEVYEAYLGMFKDRSIYAIIPDTDEGRDYFRAFMYSVADLKAAEVWGPLTDEQIAELAVREGHFLALEDLDFSVNITFEDGTVFKHDGHPPAAAS